MAPDERVTYYSKNDMSVGLYLSRCLDILNNHCDASEYSTLSDVIELYNIIQFVENDVLGTNISGNKLLEYKDKVKHFPSIISKYLISEKGEDLVDEFKNLGDNYYQSFCDIQEEYRLFDLLSDSEFDKILAFQPHFIRNILSCRKLVEKHKNFISTYLRSYPYTAELITNEYLVKKNTYSRPLYFPDLDMEAIFTEYVTSRDPNLNYLSLIAKSTKLKLSPKLKLAAKRRLEDKSLLADYKIITTSRRLDVRITNDVTDKSLYTTKDKYYITYVYEYNGDYIISGDETILIKRISALFDYFYKGIINLIAGKSETGFFEQMLISGIDNYNLSSSFIGKEYLALLQLKCCNNFLQTKGLSLEHSIELFYNAFLRKRYNYSSHTLKIQTSDTLSYTEKNRILLPEFDSVVREYNQFAESGKIDFDLLRMEKGILVTESKSSLNLKYLELCGDKNEINGILNLMFSDQSLLSYAKGFKEYHCLSFFDLIRHHKVPFSAFEKYQTPEIQYLIDKNIIKVQEGCICFCDITEIMLLKDIYENRVVSYWHYNEDERKILDRYVLMSWLREDGHLLSQPERDYFSYYLNNQKFDNALSLRNKYVHGAIVDESDAREDYCKSLLLFIILLLKIEDDLCLTQNYTLIKN